MACPVVVAPSEAAAQERAPLYSHSSYNNTSWALSSMSQVLAATFPPPPLLPPHSDSDSESESVSHTPLAAPETPSHCHLPILVDQEEAPVGGWQRMPPAQSTSVGAAGVPGGVSVADELRCTARVLTPGGGARDTGVLGRYRSPLLQGCTSKGIRSPTPVHHQFQGKREAACSPVRPRSAGSPWRLPVGNHSGEVRSSRSPKSALRQQGGRGSCDTNKYKRVRFCRTVEVCHFSV